MTQGKGPAARMLLRKKRGRPRKFGPPEIDGGNCIAFTDEERNILLAAGIDESFISLLRNGHRTCSKEMAIRIHILTGRPLLELMFGDKNIETRLRPQKRRAASA